MNRVFTSRKVVVVGVFGDRGVGKTALLSMFMKGDTDALGRNQSSSLVPMNALPNTMVITVDGGQDVSMTGSRCDAFIVMYSVVEKSSLETAISICKEIQNIRGSNNCPMVIVGNKADLEGMADSTSGGFVEEMLSCKHMTASAKLNQNIKPVFQYILDHPSMPSSSSDMAYKLQEQNKSTPDLCPKIGFPENSSFRQKSGSLSCTNSDKHRWFRRQGRTHDNVHLAPVPRSRYAIRELTEEYADRESKKTSQEKTEDLGSLSPNRKINSDASMINDNSCYRRGRFSSVDSEEPLELQLQRRTCKDLSPVEVRRPMCNVPIAVGEKSVKPISVSMKSPTCDAPVDMKMKPRVSQDASSTGFRRSVSDKTSVLKLFQNKADKNVFENVKVPQKKGKRVANGESRHRSVCETLPSLPRKKSGRLTSVDLSYLSACETLQKSKARQNKYDRVSLSDSQDFDATSDLRISGNTDTCFLNTPVNEVFNRDIIRSFNNQGPSLRPRVNCNVPLNDSEIHSLRKNERGCQVM